MKQILTILLALCLLTGCSSGREPSSSTDSKPGSTAATTPMGSSHPLSGMRLTEIMAAIYEKEPLELSLGNIEVDLQDPYAVESYLGLGSSTGIREALASESLFGAQAYSLVLVRVSEGADATSIARAMADGIDQRKWVCVYADDLKVSVSGDVIMLIMLSSEYAKDATAQSLTEAFRQVAGGLTAQIR